MLAIALSLALAALDGLWFSAHAAIALATIAGVMMAGVIASAARQDRKKELVNVTRTWPAQPSARAVASGAPVAPGVSMTGSA